MTGPTASGLLLGLFAFLLGIAAILAAFRRRRRRSHYPETYAASGGVFYTGVQVGCGVLLLIGGLGLMTLALIYHR